MVICCLKYNKDPEKSSATTLSLHSVRFNYVLGVWAMILSATLTAGWIEMTITELNSVMTLGKSDYHYRTNRTDHWCYIKISFQRKAAYQCVILLPAQQEEFLPNVILYSYFVYRDQGFLPSVWSMSMQWGLFPLEDCNWKPWPKSFNLVKRLLTSF